MRVNCLETALNNGMPTDSKTGRTLLFKKKYTSLKKFGCKTTY